MVRRLRRDQRVEHVGSDEGGRAEHARGGCRVGRQHLVRAGRVASRSSVPVHPLAGSVLYGGSKAMLDRLTTGAAMELYPDNIAVNSLAPNRGVATAHAAAAVPGWPSEPEETMAEAALLLCSGDPAKIT